MHQEEQVELEVTMRPKLRLTNVPQFFHAQFIEDLSLCDNLVHYFRSNPDQWLDGIAYGMTKTGEDSGKVSTDIYCSSANKDPDINEFVRQLQIVVDKYIELYPRSNCTVSWNLEPFNIQRYGPGEGFLKWHCERSIANEPSVSRHLAFMMYCNTIEDGGGTEFWHQDWISKSEKGKIVIFPTDWTATHRGLPCEEEKIILTGWFNFAKDYSVMSI